MYELFFSDNAAVFTVPAIVGTVFFILRLVMMLTVGLGDVDVHGDHHGDSSEAFKVLSIQAIFAFLMGFGWGGLGGLKGSDWGWTTSLAVGVVAGAAMVWLLGTLLRGVYRLQSAGNIPIDDAVGCQGSVYANIPAHGQGRGQVRIVVDERQRIYNAVSDDKPLPTNTPVRVMRVNDDNTLTVSQA